MRNIGIIVGRHRMGHVHVGSMYQLRHKEVKESLCDSLIILLSFESQKCYGKDIKTICHMIRGIDAS